MLVKGILIKFLDVLAPGCQLQEMQSTNVGRYERNILGIPLTDCLNIRIVKFIDFNIDVR